MLASLSRRLFTTTTATMRSGPLKGIKVVELAGLAPVPHCGMILADFGADVTVVDRPEGGDAEQRLIRGKKIVTADLKKKEGVAQVRSLLSTADVLLDPFRPGVLEKLGLDPVDLLEKNQKLVVCRLTGYGQFGPLAQEAGHDINYVALSGLLPTIGGYGKHPHWPPANLLADFAGGALTSAFGITAALLERQNNGGKGAIIDSSMVEGLAYLGSFVSHYHDIDFLWSGPHASFSGGAPNYRLYETKDGKWFSIGSLEPRFLQKLIDEIGADASIADAFSEPEEMIKKFETIFKSKTRDEWTKLLTGRDTCTGPVLDLDEVGAHPHHAHRKAFQKEENKWIPAPAPRLFSRDEYRQLRDQEEAKKSKL